MALVWCVLQSEEALGRYAKPMQEQIQELRQLYLQLMKKVVGDFIYNRDQEDFTPLPPLSWVDMRTGRKHTLVTQADYKREGMIFPKQAHTMIGLKRLDNLQFCVEEILRQAVPGDLLEAGVWRGGACIFMRALLKAYGIHDRRVWVADSFAGFRAQDLLQEGLDPVETNYHSVSLEEVQAHFAAYDLLDEQVQFLPGFFDETLPQAPVQQLALLRLDADFYAPTQQILTSLYPRLAPGGFVIIDDYHIFESCRKAVQEYRVAHQIREPMRRIDLAAVYWQKEGEGALPLEGADL